MYNFRYYAIGHSYLKHGPFEGWQTNGFWGMAASAPENDYFHKLQDGLKSTFDCTIESIAENHAAYERLCVEDATEETYTTSQSYAHMRDVLCGFKPNLITLFVGGANTPATDKKSLTLFFEVLYKLVAEHKLPEAVVICTAHNSSTYKILKPIADQYGFICPDVSFIHQARDRDNPYYAFHDYPEYDKKVAVGAVEFRTHPNDRGHAAIAETFLRVAKDELAKIPEGKFVGEYCYSEYISADLPERFQFKTEPQMKVSYSGFNIRQAGDLVVFGSAPGTGASLEAEDFCVLHSCKTFYAEMAVDGATEGDVLYISFKCPNSDVNNSLPIVSGMHTYELGLPEGFEEIHGLRLAPNTKECVVSIRRMGFKR